MARPRTYPTIRDMIAPGAQFGARVKRASLPPTQAPATLRPECGRSAWPYLGETPSSDGVQPIFQT